MENKKYTIKDIANLAGVSKGTVDRVLHNRGKVSQKALDAINKVLIETDYQPNVLARGLKNSKLYTICALIPDPKKDHYWQLCVEGIDEAIAEFNSFGIRVEIHYFNPNSTNSFKRKSKIILDLCPDAVLLSPLFYKQSMQIINEYHSKNIIVSIFNDQINSELVKNYVGQDLYRSGRVAARLMELITPEEEVALTIIHIDETFNNAIHMQEKEKGFRSYFEEKGEDKYSITTLNINHLDLNNTIKNYMRLNPKVDGIFVTTSKSFKVIEALSNIEKKTIKVIGYDLLNENVVYLKNKKIDYLIHQNPKHQTYLGIVYLAEYFLFDKNVPKEKLLPIDIINSENVETYL